MMTMTLGTNPRYIRCREIDKINPFKPLMEVNIVVQIPGLIFNHPGKPEHLDHVKCAPHRDDQAHFIECKDL
jgi:hypothetical protein